MSIKMSLFVWPRTVSDEAEQEENERRERERREKIVEQERREYELQKEKENEEYERREALLREREEELRIKQKQKQENESFETEQSTGSSTYNEHVTSLEIQRHIIESKLKEIEHIERVLSKKHAKKNTKAVEKISEDESNRNNFKFKLRKWMCGF